MRHIFIPPENLKKFNELGLSDELLKRIEQMGFDSPTPIQEQAIPYLLEDGRKDFIGLAQTGTGKTAAFGLPLIDLVDANASHVQALILSPTRELGQQIAVQFNEFSKSMKKVNVEVVYGGAAISNQIKALQKPTQIVVATPGRLLDLIRRKAIDLNSVSHVVLDEADEMLNMGFQEDIDAILENVKTDNSLWLFSATMPSGIRKIIKSYMSDPFEVSVKGKEETNQDISHQYVVTTSDNKVAALKRFLAAGTKMKAILFCRTKWETQKISDQLNKEGFNTEALHGDLSQAQRDSAMNRFKSKNVQLLCATDVAARGIDVNDLTHVMHHKLPDQLEAYTHRSGRTGRAGKKGISLAFINGREGRRINELEKKLKITFEKIEVPSQKDVELFRLQSWAADLIGIEEDGEAFQLYQKVSGYFEALSKEEVITKLIQRELKHFSNDGDIDLNAKEGKRDKEKDRKGDKKKRREDDRREEQKAASLKYQMNIGYADGVNKRDFLQFIVDMSGISRKEVGDIHLDANKAVFEIRNKGSKNFEVSFQNIHLDNGQKLQLKLLGKAHHQRKGHSSPRRKNNKPAHKRRRKRG